MNARPHITSDERRRRVAVRHGLAPGTKFETVADAAAAVVALHATDTASAFLQARARMSTSSPEAIDRELYDDRAALRLLAMRRTLFMAHVGDVPVIHAAASLAVGATERKRTIAMMEGAGIGPDPAALLGELEEIGVAAVRAMGEASTAELTRLDPRLALKMTLSRGKSYEATISLSQKVFFHLALDGRIGRGRPLGSWLGSQTRWSPIERWLPDGIAALPVEEARTELVRRWLRAFGPGTLADIKWWTGWSLGATRNALASVGAAEVEIDGDQPGYALPDDLEPTEEREPWVALLPALDAATMGWRDRAWYLADYQPALFDTAGNAGPTVWVDGRIVGGWAQLPSGEIVPHLLEGVGRETSLAIDEEAARLADWLGPTRIRWSFPTPLETRLRSSGGGS
ncbi:MAG: winged helix DNA-binding domain-containing protein [Chloroflexota bacterium]